MNSDNHIREALKIAQKIVNARPEAPKQRRVKSYRAEPKLSKLADRFRP